MNKDYHNNQEDQGHQDDYHNTQEDQGDQDGQDDLDDLDDNDVEVAECNEEGAGWCGTSTPCNIYTEGSLNQT